MDEVAEDQELDFVGLVIRRVSRCVYHCWTSSAEQRGARRRVRIELVLVGWHEASETRAQSSDERLKGGHELPKLPWAHASSAA